MTIIDHFGAIAASDWVDPFHHRKPIPAGCREVYRCEVPSLPERARITAEKLLRARPRVRKIIVRVDAIGHAPGEKGTAND